MTPVIRVDDDLMNEIKRRAVEYNMVFSTPNDVLKKSLGLTKITNNESMSLKESEPKSKNTKVQKLIDGLLPTIQKLSSGFYLSKHRRWITRPDNFTTITVQDARAKNLAITVRGTPNKFVEFSHALDIKDDRHGYSRFKIDREEQLPAAVEAIKKASVL